MDNSVLTALVAVCPAIVSALTAIGSVFACLKNCKKIADTHDEDLKKEVEAAKEEASELRKQNKTLVCELAALTAKVETIVENAKKFREAQK